MSFNFFKIKDRGCYFMTKDENKKFSIVDKLLGKETGYLIGKLQEKIDKLNSKFEGISFISKLVEKQDVLEKQIEKILDHINNVEKEYRNSSDLREEIGKIKGELSAKEKLIEELKAEQEKQIKELKAEQEKQIKELKADKIERDREFDNLTTENNRLKESYNKIEADKNTLINEKKSLESELSELSEQIKYYQNNISAYEANKADLIKKAQEEIRAKEVELSKFKKYAEKYADFDELNNAYNLLSDDVKSDCKLIFGASDNIVSIVFNVTNRLKFDNLWGYLFDKVNEGKTSEENIENLKKIFDISFKFMCLLDRNFERLQTKKGDEFDYTTMNILKNVKSVKCVNEVLLLGYRRGNFIQPSLVK